ncbi:MAG: carboxypeptidase-like regulatory domain-containing protein [Deltaproteobacteria bacterium]|nr:carboxypeptidase-like regulatory domain-containing protein [Deltaproteobacteria bacterium]
MKKYMLGVLACAVLLLFFASSVSAGWWHTGWGRHYQRSAQDMERVHPWARLVRSGDISGTVVCEEDPSPVSGALVYLAGESFTAKTNELGEFTLYNVPRGSHRLVVAVAGVANAPVEVNVKARCVTDVGEIQVKCPEVNVKSTDDNPPVPPDPTLFQSQWLHRLGSSVRSTSHWLYHRGCGRSGSSCATLCFWRLQPQRR